MPEKDTHSEHVRKKFAYLLKKERESRGLNVHQFGKLMGFKDHHMQIKYEKAEVKIIPMSTYVKFSELVGKPCQDVMMDVYFDVYFDGEETIREREEFFSIVDKNYFKKIIKKEDTIGNIIKKSNEMIKIAHFISMLPEHKKLNLYEEVLNEAYKLETTTEEQKQEIKKDLHTIYEDMLKLIENKLKASDSALST